jgi:small subunit ribosomal protein S21
MREEPSRRGQPPIHLLLRPARSEGFWPPDARIFVGSHCSLAAAPEKRDAPEQGTSPGKREWGAGRLAITGERPLVQIFVRDNNVDQALKALKKKMQREGSFREMKRHVHYEKPSEKRARQKAEAVRRARKLARKRAQREGLIAAPKKPAPR